MKVFWLHCFCLFLERGNMHTGTWWNFPAGDFALSGRKVFMKMKITDNYVWKPTREKNAATLQNLYLYPELKPVWWECELVQPLWRTVWRFLKKLKIELLHNPEVPLLGIYPDKTIIWKDTCTSIFIAALFTIAKTWRQPRCPSAEEWIKKTWYMDTMEYYSAIKRGK